MDIIMTASVDNAFFRELKTLLQKHDTVAEIFSVDSIFETSAQLHAKELFRENASQTDEREVSGSALDSVSKATNLGLDVLMEIAVENHLVTYNDWYTCLEVAPAIVKALKEVKE